MAETMHALVYHGTNDLRLEERPLPQIQDPRDAIVKVELSSICASDLHIHNGAVPRALPGTVLGHEFVGEVVATGSEVRKVRPGQRVAANVETFCGTCWFCRQGYVNNCRHGGWELGCRIDGCQTEYVRVPFADNGLDPIPDSLWACAPCSARACSAPRRSSPWTSCPAACSWRRNAVMPT